jgi:hypothetical protein
MDFLPQPKELLKKKLESSKVDAALIDRRLAALEGQETPTSTLVALRAVSRMYRENIETLKQAIRRTRSPSRKVSLNNATKI